MKAMTIGELARRADIAPSAVRYYEQRGLLPAPPRRNGRRVYSPAALDQIALIKLAQRAGFSLAEIQRLIHDPAPLSARWRTMAQHKLAEIAAREAQLQTMKQVLRRGIACQCADLSTCTFREAV